MENKMSKYDIEIKHWFGNIAETLEFESDLNRESREFWVAANEAVTEQFGEAYILQRYISEIVPKTDIKETGSDKF